jgi:hypothetical protein
VAVVAAVFSVRLRYHSDAALLSEIVFETLPGGGTFSVVLDGVGLGFMLADKKPDMFQMQVEWVKVEPEEQ